MADKSFKSVSSAELQDLITVQKVSVDITNGLRNFEHPNHPRIALKSKYKTNQIEDDFAVTTRNTIMYHAFYNMMIGSLGPYCGLRLFSMWRKRIIPSTFMMISCSFGALIGGMYGIAVGNVSAAQQYLQLEGSPLATEMRYQLKKINPHHPFLDLRLVENEMENTNIQSTETNDFESGYKQYGNTQVHHNEDPYFDYQAEKSKQTWS